MATLRQENIEHALVNAGGDIAVLGGKGENKPWRIAIQDPQNKNKSIDTLSLRNGAIATSGNYEVFYDREKLYHHLISPDQGRPVNENISVSIQASSVMEADALATGVFVMGSASGKKFLRQQRSLAGLIVDRNTRRFSSAGWHA